MLGVCGIRPTRQPVPICVGNIQRKSQGRDSQEFFDRFVVGVFVGLLPLAMGASRIPAYYSHRIGPVNWDRFGRNFSAWVGFCPINLGGQSRYCALDVLADKMGGSMWLLLGPLKVQGPTTFLVHTRV